MKPLLAFDIMDVVQDILEALLAQSSLFGVLGSTLGPIFLWLLPALGLCWFIYFLISLPMRRQERARFFLDLVETGLKRGQSPEHTIIGAAGAGDPVLGRLFQRLARHLENGLRLDRALDQVPRLLSPSVTAALKVGIEIGDLA